jgi:nucleoside-diphosphate-sugar epimerase
MRNALVFGGTGQIGAPLLDRLRAGGWRVVAVSRARSSTTRACAGCAATCRA